MYFYPEEDGEIKNAYTVRLSNEFYKYVTPYYKGDSYWNIVYRLYNLLPYDFYHYISSVYHAHYRKMDKIRWFKILFYDKKDCEAFCRDLNTRMEYCVKSKYFKEDE